MARTVWGTGTHRIRGWRAGPRMALTMAHMGVPHLESHRIQPTKSGVVSGEKLLQGGLPTLNESNRQVQLMYQLKGDWLLFCVFGSVVPFKKGRLTGSNRNRFCCPLNFSRDNHWRERGKRNVEMPTHTHDVLIEMELSLPPNFLSFRCTSRRRVPQTLEQQLSR